MAKRLKALIVGNGSIEDYGYYSRLFEEEPYIICADGGAKHLVRFGVKPHMLLGDFDSITNKDFSALDTQTTEILKFPAEKDMTDTELAVETAISKGFRHIDMIGVLGTRFDHSLSNIFLLKKMLDAGVTGSIINEKNEIMVTADRIVLKSEPGIKITLLPLDGNAEGVTTKSLYYPLNNAVLKAGSSWGVSNEFTSDTAEVTVQKGILLVIRARD